jgi:hypothetical protein
MLIGDGPLTLEPEIIESIVGAAVRSGGGASLSALRLTSRHIRGCVDGHLTLLNFESCRSVGSKASLASLSKWTARDDVRRIIRYFGQLENIKEIYIPPDFPVYMNSIMRAIYDARGSDRPLLWVQPRRLRCRE